MILLALFLAALFASVPYLIWGGVGQRVRDPSYVAFASSIGMTARYRYLLDPGEFLGLKIPKGTSLREVRRRLPKRYVLEDHSVYSYALFDCDWMIVLGEGARMIQRAGPLPSCTLMRMRTRRYG